MAVDIVIPSAGESVTKVLIGNWLKTEGQYVNKDEVVVEIETDKATMEVPSPVAGTIAKIVKKTGDSAAVGDVLASVEAGVGAPTAAVPAAAQAVAAASSGGAKPVVVGEKAAPGGEARVMPAAARLAAEQGVAVAQVSGTGPGGRILKEDVQRFADGGAKAPAARTVTNGDSAGRAAQPGSANRPVSADGPRAEDPVPMTPMRQKIAARLVEAQHTAAILTTFNEVDMSAVMELRKQHQDAFEKKYKLKLGFMSFFVKAAIDALKMIPQVNAEVRELPTSDGTTMPHIVYRNYYDIGVAVSGSKGLVVPVIRNAERLSFAEIEQVIAEYGARARENKIKLEELTGGTFTISNGGIFGSLMSTPILNPPQSGILGMHAIQERPVARDGQIVIRPMMYIAMSYDHRIIDGREAVTFLKRIKECVENPARMLIEV